MAALVSKISGIPVVDFSAMGLRNKDPLSENSDDIKRLADQVYHAFSRSGFVYLKNHGIPQEMCQPGQPVWCILLHTAVALMCASLQEEIPQQKIDSVFETYDKFFNLSVEVKEKYSKKIGTSPDGWDAVERESTNPERPGDLKESFDVGSVDDENFNWPNADVPDFQKNVTTIYQYLAEVALRVLSCMAIGLQMKPDAFAYAYQKMGSSLGGAQLRYNYYPLIKDISKVKPGQIRCGEHTDYGGITLLIQDDVGGLEVTNLDGQFVPATPMKGTLLVHIADLMQMWTADKLKSTVHRVVIPEVEVKRRVPRRSLVFFADPDNDALITCMDGTDKYPPITAAEWIKSKLRATYKY